MKMGGRFLAMMVVLALLVSAGLLWIFQGLVIPWQMAGAEKRAGEIAFYIGRAFTRLDPVGADELFDAAMKRSGDIGYILFEDTSGVIIAHNQREKVGKRFHDRETASRPAAFGPAAYGPAARSGSGKSEIWERHDEKSGLPGQREKVLNYVLPIYDSGGAFIGSLNVGFSLTKVEEAKLRYHFMLIIIVTLMVCVILMATYGVFSGVISPVEQIAAAVSDYAAGKKPDGLPVDRSDEIGILAREFGRLTETIDGLLGEVTARERELSEYVDSLLSFNARITPDGAIITANEATCSLTGVAREKIAGLKYWEIFSSILDRASVEKLKNLILKASADSDVRFAEFQTNSAHERRYLDVSVSPVGASGTKDYCLIVEGIDITVLRNVEEDLRFKSLLLDNSKNSIFAVDHSGRILYANETAAREFGFSADELVLSKIERLFAGVSADRSDVEKPLERLGDLPQTAFESEMARRNGSVFPVEVQLSAAEIMGKRIAICVVRDRTDEKRAAALLRQSEENLKTIFESAHYAIIIADLDGRIVDVNEKGLSLLGVSKDSAGIYSFTFDYTATGFPQGPVIEAWNLAAEGRNQIFEWKARRPSDGSIVTVEVYLQRIFLEHQEYVMVTMHDVTERKRAEELLRKSEEHYRAIIEDSFDIIAIVNRDDAIKYVSGSVKRWTGYDASDVLGRNFFELVHPEDIEYAKQLYEQLKAGNVEFIIMEVRCLGSGGAYRTFEILAKNQLNIPSIDGIVCNLRDITEKRRAEAELEKSLTLYQEFANLMPQTVFETDIAGNFTFVNRFAYEAFGYTAADVEKGLNAMQMVAPEDRQRAAESFANRLRDQVNENRYFTMLRKDGSKFSAMIYTMRVMENGKPAGLRGLAIDITQLKTTEAELRLDESRLEALLSLNQMTSSSFTEITDFVLAECVKLTLSEGGFIAFLNEDQTELRVASRSGAAAENIPGLDQAKILSVKMGLPGILAEPVRQKRPLVFNDLSAADVEQDRNSPDGMKVFRYVGVPVFEDGRVVAVAGVLNKKADYADADVRQLTLLMEGMMRMMEIRRAHELIREKDQKAMEALEEKVLERTAELSLSNQKLSAEIVERKKAQEEIHAREERYRALTENIYDLVCETSIEGQYLYLTPNNEEVLGYTNEDLLGRYYYEFIHPEDLEAVNQTFMKGLQGIKSEVVFRYRHKQGHYLWFNATGKLYYNAAGEPRAVIISREITAKKKLEEEMLKISKLESLGILAGGIAHDFNNVLMGVIGNLTLAKKRVKPEERLHELLVRAEKVAYKAKNLTEQLITFSKGGLPIKKICVINDLVRESVQFTLTGTNLECSYKLAGDLWSAEVDDGQISQVMTNLVINSKQSMADGGKIEISTENCVLNEDSGVPLEPGRYVKVVVSDNGCGISRENISKIFDPYFSTKATGSGLGLSTSYSIIRNHNGFITADSQPGSGSCFTIYLPARFGAEPSPAQCEKPYVPVKFGMSRRILVMDDDETVIGPLAEMLKDMGFLVERSYDGEEAVTLYKKYAEMGSPFLLVIMDLVVPGGMGGIETLKKLREFDPEVRAIVSSGYSSDPVMANYAANGFCGVLVKPYRCEDMERIITSVLS